MRLKLMMQDFMNKDDYCSLEYFIKKYDVSKRTIQNDISYLMRVAPRKGYQLHMKRGQGYLLEITNRQLLDDFLESLDEGVSFQTKERPANILAYIVIQNGFISMNKIAEICQVSKTLVKKDMDDVEKLAEKYHFTLKRKSHYGVQIIGEDHYIKNYLVDEYINENVFVQTAINDIVEDFREMSNEFIHLLDKEGLNINYNELVNVVEYLKIMTYLSNKNKEKDEEFLWDESQPLHRITKGIIEKLKISYKVGFLASSIEQLINILQKNVRKAVETLPIMDHLNEDIDEFLKKIDETYKTSFLDDQVFKELLLTHVSLLVDRLRNKISYKNALANEISITNPMIFNIAIQFSDMLKEKYNVESTFDEIGFVAMHFAGHMEKEKQQKLQSYNRIGVVCSSGGGSAYIIKVQIESLFPNARVQTFSFLQQKELLKYEPDLVFTVMPLMFEINVPVIYIKELLDDKDLYVIKQLLQCEEYDPFILVNENPIYQSYFSKDFFKRIKGNDYKSLIYQMAMELEKKGYGKEGYANLVLERESYVSTIYLNGVCIPHPIETDAYKNIVYVGILDKPFNSEDKEVKIIFMICLKKEQIEIYKSITKMLYQLMKDVKKIHQMINANSFEEFMAILKKMGGVDHE